MLSFSHLALYLSVLNLGLLSITTYQSGWIQEHIWSDINFFQFIAGIGVVVILGLVLVSRLHVPAFMASWNKQFWENQNPMRKFMEEKDAKDDERLKRMEETLDRLALEYHLRHTRGRLRDT